MNVRHATPRAPIRYEDLLSTFPGAGPRPSVAGMKKIFWGENSYCVRCGEYVYKVDRETWERFLNHGKC